VSINPKETNQFTDDFIKLYIIIVIHYHNFVKAEYVSVAWNTGNLILADYNKLQNMPESFKIYVIICFSCRIFFIIMIQFLMLYTSEHSVPDDNIMMLYFLLNLYGPELSLAPLELLLFFMYSLNQLGAFQLIL
jgi:hypothetical protein